MFPSHTARLQQLALMLVMTTSALSCTTGIAAEGSRTPAIAGFSSASPGTGFPPGWAVQTLPGVEKPNRFELHREGGETVLYIASDRSASTLAFPVRADITDSPLLSWRWKVSRAVDGSDFRQKAGDDYAARVYVLFDLPPERLSVGERMKISAARLLNGVDIPAAALCYVWGNKQAAGESAPNPYTDRVRMIVVDSGNEHAGQWQTVTRDVVADFKSAFGEPVPPIAGLAVSADTDNTAEAVETRFGDLHFEARP